ncbi:hypothetical protein EC973_003842 [Apophysomyces ossiformis]|uniref:MHYT domain-containing protein n=1 Tax=Apophysomyces ossiformis TaxID=679940 RepID=A0A8H7ESR6_9FUNG|nr:hypothetical protein EC973_003842 [Apophysomyces ossiformis]
MGGIGIWSMHFIGNNSLTIKFGEDWYQLAYGAGYTFASLIVAISCMFIAFAFVGVTEEARVVRILPSGIIAGLGIATMHYLGQMAICYFEIRYRTAYVVAAVIIACSAVTAALFIFFKLREQWMNQWYKRLGCAMLMAVAVCGMHYTAMVGTEYYKPNASLPPTPALRTAALIGIISAIVVLACILLLYVSAKGYVSQKSSTPTAERTKRLILDVVFFDPTGKILVRVDGTVPTKEILHSATEEEFSVSHPLFIGLFETTRRWRSQTKFVEPTDEREKRYIDAATDLANELRLSYLGEMGILFDKVVRTHTIKKSNRISLARPQLAASRLMSSTNHFWAKKDGSAPVRTMTAIIMEDNPPDFRPMANEPTENTEDRHVFLVRKLENNKDLVRLLSQGFRFAEPHFIAKTMGMKLQIPAETMLSHFRDMQRYVDSPFSKRFLPSDLVSSVYVGLLIVVDEAAASGAQILVDKAQPYSLPLIGLAYDDNNKGNNKLTRLDPDEKHCVLSLQGQLLSTIASLGTHFQFPRSADGKGLLRFARAFEDAAQKLLNLSTFGLALGNAAKLVGEVIDVPAFVLQPGPCQLILFQARFSIPGTTNAINQKASEPFKCLPIQIFRSLVSYITDQAVDSYRNHNASAYLDQQRVYQLVHEETEVIKERQQQQQPEQPIQSPGLPSLPPPPRSKKPRFPFPSLEINAFKEQSKPASLSSSSASSSTRAGSTSIELPVLLNILPTRERFQWFDRLIDNILHPDQHSLNRH